MAPPPPSPARSAFVSLLLIAVIVGFCAVAFAYTAGWFSPERLTPNKVVDAFAPPGGPALGHRRNHAKGICFTGVFEANGAGSTLSKAAVFLSGQYPIVGRFNLASPNLNAPDATVRLRGMGLQITAPGGQVWRTAMIDAPFFPVSTPQALYGLTVASGSKDPNAMKNFVAAHAELATFGAWAQSAPWTVRWSLVPAAQPVSVQPDELAKGGPDVLEQEITQRVKSGPLQWAMVITVANPGDPTADPSKAWPPDRRSVEVGKLIVQQIEPEPDGPCRDINYDPTILPSGIGTSDDPFPAARSSAYRRSFDLRTAEEKDYPRTAAEAKP